MAPDPLKSLAESAIEGDRAAMERLLRQVTPPMIAVTRQVVPAPLVEDSVQEALLGFAKSLSTFQFQCSVKHFACRIAVRTGSVVRRREAGQVRRDDRGREAAEHAAPGETPTDHAQAAEGHLRMMSLLSQLPPEQAETLALRVVMGYSLAETAEATGVPVNTVRSRVRLAKKALASLLAETPEGKS